jgi:hypothetical protein
MGGIILCDDDDDDVMMLCYDSTLVFGMNTLYRLNFVFVVPLT